TSVIAVLQHLRDRDPAEDGCGSCARTGNRRKSRSGEYGGDGESARQPAEPAAGGIERPLRQAGVIGEITDENEHRQDAERVVARFRVGEKSGETSSRIPPAEHDETDETGDARRVGDAHAEDDHHDDGDDRGDASVKWVHMAYPP